MPDWSTRAVSSTDFSDLCPVTGPRPTAASPRSSKFKTTRVLPLPSALNIACARPGRLAWNGGGTCRKRVGKTVMRDLTELPTSAGHVRPTTSATEI